MIGLALFFAGALVGYLIARGVVASRSADVVVNLQVENALLQDRIAKGDAAWLAKHQIDSTRVADEREAL